MSSESRHRPVLLNETIEYLALSPDQTVVDATIGAGGHAQAICQAAADIRLIGLDLDRKALERSGSVLRSADCRSVELYNGSFRDLKTALQTFNITAVDRVLFDLGYSSDQLDTSGRGFSFLSDEPLLMTLSDQPAPGELTAAEIVNHWPLKSLTEIIRGYSEERYATRIAQAITQARLKAPIKTTGELVRIIENAVPGPYRRSRIHPATRTFQALRIAVNDELGSLRQGLEQALDHLSANGRLAVISFHSLEDRMVKQYFRYWSQNDQGTQLTKKPLRPTPEEIEHNPRARSAKLRVFQSTA